MSKWISVEDRMPGEPAKFQEYLVCCGKAVTCAWLDQDADQWYWVTDPERVLDSVTHWMPMPEPPNDTKDNSE